MSRAQADVVEQARTVAAGAPDPELPMLTIADLGILRDVLVTGERVEVLVTPTYSGCPAMAEIRADLVRRLSDAGFHDVKVRTVLSPPWTTDWISDEGRWKLAAAGVAPPQAAPPRPAGPVPLTLTTVGRPVPCPSCGSMATERTAAFGSTACKDLYRCTACTQPFEHVKEI